MRRGEYRDAVQCYCTALEELSSTVSNLGEGTSPPTPRLTTIEVLSNGPIARDANGGLFSSRAFLPYVDQEEAPAQSSEELERATPRSKYSLSVLSAIALYNLGLTFQILNLQTGKEAHNKRALCFYSNMVQVLEPLKFQAGSSVTILYLSVLANITGLFSKTKKNETLSLAITDFLNAIRWADPESSVFVQEMSELMAIALSLGYTNLDQAAPAA